MYKVKNEQGEWVEVAKPENGQQYRLYHANGGMLESVWSDPQPEPPKTKITRLAAKQRFTQSERITSRQSSDPIVQDFMDLMSDAQYIDLARQDTVQGVQYLEQTGIIGTGRADEILTNPVQPEEEYMK